MGPQRLILNPSRSKVPKGSITRTLTSIRGLDVDASPIPTSPGLNVDGAMPSPVLGGREARRLERTTAGQPGMVEGRTHGDVCQLQAVQSAGLLAGEVGLVPLREDFLYRAA